MKKKTQKMKTKNMLVSSYPSSEKDDTEILSIDKTSIIFQVFYPDL
jgi:hypothetical protein